MALIVGAVNKSDLAEVSDYEIRVLINEYDIAKPFMVKGHKRSDGWLELLRLIVKTADEQGITGRETLVPRYVPRHERELDQMAEKYGH